MTSTGSIRVGVVGIGGMGSRWAQVSCHHPASTLVAVSHLDRRCADACAQALCCDGYTDWRHIVQRADIDAVVVATPHALLTEVSQAALAAGKHVFCEKPGGISSAEIQRGVDLAERMGLRYRVNFQIRLHPAVALAKRKVDVGEIGGLVFLKAVYGHAGREGYEREWWCDKRMSGGGELIDQGSHIIDLAHWFLGSFTTQAAFLETGFWPIAPLEDNAFLLLRSVQGTVAQLHASWTHWKKTFRLELYGTEGYLVVNGLGGQYGLERLTQGKRVFGGEAPRETAQEFPSAPGKPDIALQHSWEEFVQSVRQGWDIGQSARNAAVVLRVIERGYAAQGKTAIDCGGGHA